MEHLSSPEAPHQSTLESYSSIRRTIEDLQEAIADVESMYPIIYFVMDEAEEARTDELRGETIPTLESALEVFEGSENERRKILEELRTAHQEILDLCKKTIETI